MLEFRLLGQFEVWSGDERRFVGGGGQQALLAALVLDIGQTVSVERLASVLWDGKPPPTYRQQVYKRVHALRSVLDATAVVTEEAGYRLDLPAHCSDAVRFADLVASARASQSVRAFRKALSLWRKPALDGIESTVLRKAGAELDEQRRQVLRECAELEQRLAEDRPGAPACLPMDMPSFTGRAAELAELDRVHGGAQGTAVVITSIAGTAGVGKTALAVHWAHRARHLFPDGQLYVNLRGFDRAGPMSADAALTLLLRELGMPSAHIPVEPEALSLLYRSTVDGKRLLIVLDNAADACQVRPLLPGSPGCFVIVTSRNALAGLSALHDAKRITLDSMSADESSALLAQVLGSDAVAADPAAAARLAELCGHLPLALRVAAANLTRHGSVADLAGRLAEGDRLTQLRIDGDPDASVAAAFDLSYGAVRPAARDLLRLLSVAPGPDLALDAVTALNGGDAAELLDELETTHLVEQYLPGRYRLHDLIKLYARSRGDDDAAITRLLGFYLTSVEDACALLSPLTSSPPRAGRFTDGQEAMGWLESECQNLVAATEWAHERGADLLCTRLVDALRGVFWLNRRIGDWLSTGELGLGSARRLGDAALEAAMHRTLGLAHYVARDMDSALDHSFQAIGLWLELGDWEGAAGMRLNLAIAYLFHGRHDIALKHARKALSLGDEHGLERVQVTALSAEIECEMALGDAERTERAADRLRRMALASGDKAAQANALAARGWALHQLGRTDEAEADFAASAALDVKARHAYTLEQLGGVFLSLGYDATAELLIKQSRVKGHELAEPRWKSESLHGLAQVQHHLGRLDEALRLELDALRIADDVGHTPVRIESLLGLTDLMLARGEPLLAEEHAVEALRVCEEHGWALFLGRARHALAAVNLALGRPEDARKHAEMALELHRGSGQRLREAETLALLARLG
ncbi:ATP-binding protein [Amycolatopsis sp. NPDC059657]|uniref:ATP-binding protein n=1 Tax=Amycolatopsis sp. NPDC059657 TaxID=3346899 RepID=UPI00366D04CE